MQSFVSVLLELGIIRVQNWIRESYGVVFTTQVTVSVAFTWLLFGFKQSVFIFSEVNLVEDFVTS